MKRMNIQMRMIMVLVMAALGVNGLLYGVVDIEQRKQDQEEARAMRREEKQRKKRLQLVLQDQARQAQDKERRAQAQERAQKEAARQHIEQLRNPTPSHVEYRGQRASEMMKRRQRAAERARDIIPALQQRQAEARDAVGALYDEFYEAFPVIRAILGGSEQEEGRFFSQEPVSLDDERLGAIAYGFGEKDVNLGVLIDFFQAIGGQGKLVRKSGAFEDEFLSNYSNADLNMVLTEVVKASHALHSLRRDGVEIGAFSRLHHVGAFISKIIKRRAEIQKLDTRRIRAAALSSSGEYVDLVTRWYGSLETAASFMMWYTGEYKVPDKHGRALIEQGRRLVQQGQGLIGYGGHEKGRALIKQGDRMQLRAFMDQDYFPDLSEGDIKAIGKGLYKRRVDASMLEAQIMLFKKIAQDRTEALNAYPIETLKDIYSKTWKLSNVLQDIDNELSRWLADVALPFIQKVVNAKEIRRGMPPSRSL